MKKLSRIILITSLFLSNPITSTQTSANTAAQITPETQSWGDWIIGCIAKAMLGGVPQTALEHDPHVKQYEEQLKDYTANIEEYYEDIATALASLKNHHGYTIPKETWEKYFAHMLKELPSQQGPFEGETGRTEAYLNGMIKIHNKEHASLQQEWLSKAATYDVLQQHYADAQPSYYVKPTFRFLGYSGVFLLGPYLGNKLYTKFLHPYFNQAEYNHSDITQRIMNLEEQCSITSARLENATTKLQQAAPESPEAIKLKTSLERLEKTLATMREEIETLTIQMEKPEQPSTLRAYAGIGVRVSMIALTTYLFYTIFKKIDDRYLVHKPLAQDELNTLMHDIAALEKLKKAHGAQDALLQELQKMAQALRNKDHYTVQSLGNVCSRLQQIIRLKQAIKELKENIGKAQAHAAAPFIPNSNGWTA